MEIIYRCAVCQEKLELAGKSFICKQKHSYDISREGYVNFLLANQKKTKDPGDSKFMIENRKYFLERGYYDLLAEEINKIILGIVTKATSHNGENFTILDAGCGVGIYSNKLKKTFEKLKIRASFFGIDISKAAIQKAAKSYFDIQFCIGSTFHLPYLDESLDIIFSIFAPFDSHELLRVLKPGGKILLVRPGADHLKELGALMYDRFQLQGNPLDLSEGFDSKVSLFKKHQLTYKIELRKNEDVLSLVAMTPYYWHLNDEKRNLLAQLHEFATTVNFQLSLFQKE